MASDRDLATGSAVPATTQAVADKSTPTLTATSGTQQGSLHHSSSDEGEGYAQCRRGYRGSQVPIS